MNPSELMSKLDPRLLQLVMQDPEVMRIISNPATMQKFQALASNPGGVGEHMNDPDLQYLISRMQSLGGLDALQQQQPPPPPQQPPPTSTSAATTNTAAQAQPIVVSSASQFASLMSSCGSRLVVVDFTASWCGPCRHIAPAFAALAQTYRNSATFLKVDVDQNSDLAKTKNVRSMPTFHFYRNGSLLEEFSGANEQKLSATIERLVVSQESNDISPIDLQSPYTHFPLKLEERASFVKAKFDVILAKILEFSPQLDSKHSLDDDGVACLRSLIKIVEDRAHHHSTKLEERHFQLMQRLLDWPTKFLPPVLNLIRIAVFHPSMSAKIVEEASGPDDEYDFFSHLLSLLQECDSEVCKLVLVRTLCNLFQRLTLSRLMVHRVEHVLEVLTPLLHTETASLRLALSSLLINYSIVLIHGAIDSGETESFELTARIQCLALLSELMQHAETDAKLAYRCMLSAATLQFRDSTTKSLAKSLEMAESVQSLADKHASNADVQAVAAELQASLVSDTD